jgi:hypothetical protein
MVRVRRFFGSALGLEDFDLRTEGWTTVIERLQAVSERSLDMLRPSDVGRLQQVCRAGDTAVSSLILKKENCLKMLLEESVINLVFHVPCTRNYEFVVMTRGLQWNLMYCVVNFFFDANLMIRPTHIDPSADDAFREHADALPCGLHCAVCCI